MKRSIKLLLFLIVSQWAAAQNVLINELVSEQKQSYLVSNTFKSTRIINGQSIENVGGGVLDFRISHRFGLLSGGFYDLFGLDQALIRLGLEYGLTDKLMIGVGRNSFRKEYDGFLKYKILQQEKNKKKPVSITLFSSSSWSTIKHNRAYDALFEARLAYTTQILIAKKITENLSLQLSPSFIHRNWVPQSQQNNQTISIGLGGRYKLTKRFSINGEYFYVPKSKQDPSSFNSLSLGVDIETGGHVFQLHFTNSTSMIERGFITETNNSWLDGDIHFGFNVSRVFSLKSNTSLYE
ncbi:MAG: hypothetical protein CNE98_05040 [Bacteroidetes bacterium MED-G17]|nr:MAG: hypothetical protein CBB99_04445 [Bacteroidetes bacterium TMED39]PDH52410.1 MAG: hypothetical protein CNE98_05040 [Bacteroidetes bacterium MED-G17]CAI8297767.1 MAG: Uncharacterised protein [Bacteroidetes bacterium MED-G17]|tara:strand:+ start:3983 stop:4867 length:885 start_codon:yes stop_codon:yes gene_type:complete